MNGQIKIACFHLNQVGDLLFSLPALYNLRKKYPDAHITSIVRSGCKDLLILSGLVDDILVRPKGFKQTFLQFARRLRREKFDYMLLFSTAEEAWLLGQLSGARVKAGFTHSMRGLLLSPAVPWIPPPSTANNLRLAESLGCTTIKDNYAGLIMPGESEISAANNLLAETGLQPDDRYAVISSGTSTGREIKCWADDRFAAVADRLYLEFGMKSLVAGLNGGEGICSMSANAIDITGRTSLPVLAAVLKKSSLFIGVDSGVMHLAASVDTPVVGIFGPTDPEITGPQGTGHQIVRFPVDCSPCHRKECDNNRRCMAGVTIDMVFSAARSILEK